ncbi:MAG: hypothetical protein Q8Q31_04545 [Nanoarchaeota archaeon]|nr:hypothetical protein [Nanoarchaeota archaeon]
MKIQPYVDKLSNSGEFKNFQKQHGDAFMVAGFFILDLEMGKNLHQIDYYIPSKKKIAAFTLDQKVTVQILDLLNSKVPEKLDIKTKVDLDQIPGILEDEMKNRNITDEIKKVIAVLQNLEGKKIWNLNCILSGMNILSAHVEDESRSVLKMEKKSLMDIMKKVPAGTFKQQMAKQQPAQEGMPAEEGENPEQMQMPLQIKEQPEQIKEKIKKLEELGKELESELTKEKEALEKEISQNKQKANKSAKNTPKSTKGKSSKKSKKK